MRTLSKRYSTSTLIIITLTVFLNTLNGEFLAWDDTQHILLNQNLIAGNYKYFWSNDYYGFYIPVTYSAWTALYQSFPAPWIFHVFNILLHICSGLMVFGLSKRILKTSDSTAMIPAMLFLIHPLQVEPVAWISGGRDLLAAFFGLSAMYVLTSDRRTLFKQSCATALFALGLLSKPSLAALPAALLAFELIRKDKLFPKIALLLWCGMGAGILYITLMLQVPAGDPRLEASALGRMLVALDSMGFYIKSFIVPWPLSFSYDRRIESILTNGNFLYPSLLLLAAVFTLAALAKNYGHTVIAAAAFSLVMLLPVLGLIPFSGQAQSTVFDRYAYLPLIGIGLIFGLIAQTARARNIMFCILLLGAGFSFARTFDWRNDRSLSESALAVNHDNYIALNNLGIVEIRGKNYAAAEAHLRKAWLSRPKEALAPANLAHALWMKNDVGSVLKEIKPLGQTEIFLTFNRREPEAIALIYRITARALNATLDRAGAQLAYEKALSYRPDDPEILSEFEIFKVEISR